jgi:hypothetical protein
MQFFSTTSRQWVTGLPLFLLACVSIAKSSLQTQIVDCVSPAKMHISRIRSRLQLWVGFVLAVIILAASSSAFAQGDCVTPHGIPVAQIRGQVFDAFGIAVPFATITILGIHGAVQTTADNTGQFSFDVSSGHYVLKAEAEGFSYSSAELKVGQSWNTIFTRPKLKVMLGFNGLFCPWVTTDKKKFQDTADANLERLKKTAQIKDADQSNAISPTGETPSTKESSPTKETSQTNATQK